MHVRNRVTPPTYTHPLVGRGCHLLDKDGKPQWQGWVVASLGDASINHSTAVAKYSSGMFSSFDG